MFDCLNKTKKVKVYPPRTIPVNQPELVTKFVTNYISTGKYTVLSFLPKFLYEQFRKYANIFFLTIGLLQQIPGISPTGRYVTLVPFLVILAITAVKELVEDFKRHREDRKINGSLVKVFSKGNWEKRAWKDVCVGDILRVEDGMYFPADLMLVSTSSQDGQAYIETANLDGETNLKIRTAHPATKNLGGKDELKRFKASVEAEGPNKNLYDFSGTIEPSGRDTLPVGPSELLLRGAKLRNTKWVFGLVIYTGKESKLMMNSTPAPLKMSTMESKMNYQIIFLFAILVSISLLSSAVNLVQSSNGEHHTYIGNGEGESFFLNCLTFFILYNNLIPISLLVTLEMVRVFQAYFINCDMNMHIKETDTYAVAKTSNLNEELGQIKYVFSDKTGTLTRNIMEFKRCSVAGDIYDTEERKITSKEVKRSAVVRDFLELLAICHTVVPETAEDGGIRYNAASPDEKALVEGVKEYGYTFIGKTAEEVSIRALQRMKKYKVLAVIEFTSSRKRMSVIVKTEEGKVRLYSKGADNVMLERLGERKEQREHYGDTVKHLDSFAMEGLRTLVLAVRDISDAEWRTWLTKWKAATTALQGREVKVGEVADLIERDLTLVGATAIEDKLQDQVPETIERLLQADIHVWMLTGDKQITAENIARSCRLHKEGALLLNLSGDTAEEVGNLIRDRSVPKSPATAVIDGKSLAFALADPLMKEELVALATSCQAVICCRASPLQKADVVELVSRTTKTISLAIGDGANDVAMIQKASVGVGVSGNEGLQAVNSADFAIGQFSHLATLLFVHGAWNYARISNVILYSFYKNITLYVIELWFAIFSYWSGQVIYERWTIGMYNIMFTSLPPLALGIFDQTCSAETRESEPRLYLAGQRSELFNSKRFWAWMFISLIHSLILFFLPLLGMMVGVSWENGHSDGYLVLGNTVYTVVVITTCLKAGLLLDYWTWFCHVAIWGSIALWIVFLWIYSSLWPTFKFVASNMPGMAKLLFSSPVFWACLLLVPTTALLMDFVVAYIRFTYFQGETDRARKQDNRNINAYDRVDGAEQQQVELKQHRRHRSQLEVELQHQHHSQQEVQLQHHSPAHGDLECQEGAVAVEVAKNKSSISSNPNTINKNRSSNPNTINKNRASSPDAIAAVSRVSLTTSRSGDQGQQDCDISLKAKISKSNLADARTKFFQDFSSPVS